MIEPAASFWHFDLSAESYKNASQATPGNAVYFDPTTAGRPLGGVIVFSPERVN